MKRSLRYYTQNARTGKPYLKLNVKYYETDHHLNQAAVNDAKKFFQF
jgi:hypothetical protein